MTKISKMFLAFILLGLGMFAIVESVKADAMDNNGPPNVSRYGAKMYHKADLSLGVDPEDFSNIVIPATAACTISAGDALVLASDATVGYMEVSKTTSAGDVTAFGVAVYDTAYGKTVYCKRIGVGRVNSAVNVAKGDVMVTSGTAGKVTTAASIASSAYLYTSLSSTPIVCRAAEAFTFGGGAGGGMIIGIFGGK